MVNTLKTEIVEIFFKDFYKSSKSYNPIVFEEFIYGNNYALKTFHQIISTLSLVHSPHSNSFRLTNPCYLSLQVKYSIPISEPL